MSFLKTVYWFITCWFYLIKCQSDIQFLDLSSKYLSTYCYAGIGAIYQNKLYAINGKSCGNPTTQCDLPPTALTFTLDLSGIQFGGTNNKQISFNNGPSWQTDPVNGISSADTGTIGGFPTTSSTYFDRYAWSIYPSTIHVDGNKFIMKYDLETNTYIQQTSPEEDEYIKLTSEPQTVDACNTNDETYIYVIGGLQKPNGTNYKSNIVLQFDMTTDAWTQHSTLNIGRSRASCAVMNGKIYVFGGINQANEKIDDIEECIGTIWVHLAVKMVVGRQAAVSYPHPNNKWIITLGGRASNNSDPNVPIEIFDAENKKTLALSFLYKQKTFYSAIYKYNINTSIIFAFGGFIDSTYYNEVKYMVLNKDDFVQLLSPTKYPTTDPTIDPTKDPTTDPTNDPTMVPTIDPSIDPTKDPTVYPTSNPTTNNPTIDPTTDPTNDPSIDPTVDPTNNPTTYPSIYPTLYPTQQPSINPTFRPTKNPLPAGKTNNPTTAPTDDPTNDPTSNPTNNPMTSRPSVNPTTSEPSMNPTTSRPSINPTKSSTQPPQPPLGIDSPTISPLSENEQKEPSSAPTESSVINAASQVNTASVESLNENVNYFMIALITFCAFFMLISFIANSFIYKGCDPPNYFALLWVIMELYDFFSDISFSVYLWYLKDTEGSDIMPLFIVASIFIYCPYLMNLIYLTHRINRWKKKLRTSAIGEWLSYWDWWMIMLSMLCGGSHPSVEICNSLLFPFDAFGMHLPWTEIVRIRTERFCTTVLLENVPQLCIQLYLLTSVEAVKGNSIIYLTILSSVGSIAFSGLYYFVNQHKIKVSKNHWIFRVRLTSKDIAEHHKHSYYKLQVAISKALEIPNVEWVRLTAVQHKTDELRCDGFISIPEEYLRKKKREQSDPEKQKKKDDLRRLSAMYRNTFDEVERGEFVNRLEAAKEEESHYHKALVKQIGHDIKLTDLTVDFEIGGNKAREGGNMQQPPLILPAEGNLGHDANNDTLSYHAMGPGNSMNFSKEEADRIRDGIANGAANHEIEMQLIQHQKQQRSVSDLGLKSAKNGVFGNELLSMAAVNDGLVDDMVNAINDDAEVKETAGGDFEIDLDENDGVGDGEIVTGIEVIALPDDEIDNVENERNQTPEPRYMRTDDGMLDEMLENENEALLNENDGNKEDIKISPKHGPKKSAADLVDDEVMLEIGKETPNPDIIDVNINSVDVDVDVDAIAVDDNTDTDNTNNDEDDLLDDLEFEVDTLQ